MIDQLIFSIGCGVTAIAFGGVYVYMRSRFDHMADAPRSERGATILNREDIPDQSTTRTVAKSTEAA